MILSVNFTIVTEAHHSYTLGTSYSQTLLTAEAKWLLFVFVTVTYLLRVWRSQIVFDSESLVVRTQIIVSLKYRIRHQLKATHVVIYNLLSPLQKSTVNLAKWRNKCVDFFHTQTVKLLALKLPVNHKKAIQYQDNLWATQYILMAGNYAFVDSHACPVYLVWSHMIYQIHTSLCVLQNFISHITQYTLAVLCGVPFLAQVSQKVGFNRAEGKSSTAKSVWALQTDFNNYLRGEQPCFLRLEPWFQYFQKYKEFAPSWDVVAQL